MHVDIFTLCDFAQDSAGKLTVVGAFDTVFSRTFPAIHPLMSLAVRLRFYIHEQGEHNILIEFENSTGSSVIKPIEGRIVVSDFVCSSRVIHSIFNFLNTTLENEGTITITLYVDNKEIISSPLYVRQALEP